MSREQLTNTIPDRVHVAPKSQPSSTSSSLQSSAGTAQTSSREISEKRTHRTFCTTYEIRPQLASRISI